MSANAEAQGPPPAPTPTPIDWVDVISRAFVTSALLVLGQTIVAELKRRGEAVGRASGEEQWSGTQASSGRHPFPTADDEDFEKSQLEALQASNLLGVSLDASEDEIRAALRARLTSSRLHPDHGGDGEAAKRLIAAKNLLIERRRAVQQ